MASTPGTLKNNFVDWVKKHQTIKLSHRKENELRITTYNVHYFTDVNEYNTYQDFFKDISEINSDLVGIQEIVLGNIVRINEHTEINMNDYYTRLEKLKYKKSIVCSSVPSWFNAVYGNTLLIKNTLCDTVICEPLNESIFTFEKSKYTNTVSGIHNGTKETRCFIRVSFNYNNNNFHLYNTHLDVGSEQERLSQIKYILKESKKYPSEDIVFIMGDFNTFDINDMKNIIGWKNNHYIKDNGKVISELKNNGFIDCHSNNKAEMTTWNNTRVDFIFCNKHISGDFRAEYYYTTNSDHIPVVLTLTPKTNFNSIPSSLSLKKSRTKFKKLIHK